MIATHLRGCTRKRLTLLLLVALACTLILRWTSGPGPVGHMADGLRVGMPQESAIAIVQSNWCDCHTRVDLFGSTSRGRSLPGWYRVAAEGLPPGDPIARGRLLVSDSDGWYLRVALESGNVSGLDLGGPKTWELWYSWLWHRPLCLGAVIWVLLVTGPSIVRSAGGRAVRVVGGYYWLLSGSPHRAASFLRSDSCCREASEKTAGGLRAAWFLALCLGVFSMLVVLEVAR